MQAFLTVCQRHSHSLRLAAERLLAVLLRATKIVGLRCRRELIAGM